MDAYTAFKFNFKFDVWLDIAQPDGATFKETFYKSDVGLLVPGLAQTYLYTKTMIPFNAIIRNVVDPSGRPVFQEFDVDVRRYVTAAEPVFDYLGNVNGYRQALKRSLFKAQAT